MNETVVLAAIHAAYCEPIFLLKKLCEIRKNKPNLKPPFRVLVYCTMRRPGENFLFLDKYGSLLRPGWVFPQTYQTAVRMGMLPLNGRILGEFVCDRIAEFKVFDTGTIQNWMYADLDKSCVSYDQIASYIGTGKTGFSWHISDPVLYDQPRLLQDYGIVRAPQSWQYIRA